jgi:TolB-like protein/Flp pilus assembly protein TadD
MNAEDYAPATMRTAQDEDQLIRQELARVLSSSVFTRNERLSRFLRFLVERHLDGKDDEIKESLIAVEVFGRRPDYDPKLDSIVRTEAGRLRARLVEYYAREGERDSAVIDVPKGAYRPVFRYRESGLPRRRLWLASALVLAVIGVGVGWWWRAQARVAPIRIGVLPLENRSAEPGTEYFADGLTDEIISNLSIIEGLAVRSQTSSFAFKGKPRNIRDVGKQLDVNYILEGSVVRGSDRVRIDAQLISVRDDMPVWSGRFDRPLTDVIAIQDEISRGIVNNLRLHFGGGRRRYEASVEAYDFYLRGRALSQQGGPPRHESIGYFEQATENDPSFAPAYAALASEYAVRSIAFALHHPADELSKMRDATQKAIELDPLLAEAHDALGMIYARDGQWEQAEKSFRHAIELDPNRSVTYHDFATWFLWALGRNEEAVKQLRVAENCDPLSPIVRVHLGLVLISTERYDEAEAVCSKLPAGLAGRDGCLARARFGKGEIAEAIHLLTNASSGVLTNPEFRGFLGYFYAKAGRRDEAARLAAASQYPNEQALIFAGLGDKDRTFEALDRMRVVGAQRVGIHLNYPELASSLRGDPRLPALRQKVGLPR